MVSITMATALLFVFALLGSVSAEKPTPKPKPFEKHPCFVEPKPGPCLARFHRYFWNQETNKCDTFIWGGCQGVVPFKTKAECEKARCPYVRCGDPEPVKICRASLPRWKYDAKRDDCVPFTYGGCGPFPPFKTREECLASICIRNRCKLAPEQGICKGYFPKYFFNNKTKKCEKFIWGGCEGVVPFHTKLECQKKCPIKPYE